MRAMLLSLVYLMVRIMVRLLVQGSRGEAGRDLEIVVLRHQQNVLGDRSNSPAFDLPIGYFLPPRLDGCHGLAGSVSS